MLFIIVFKVVTTGAGPDVVANNNKYLIINILKWETGKWKPSLSHVLWPG